MDSFLLSALFAQINLARVLTTKKASIFIEASANHVCLWELRDSKVELQLELARMPNGAGYKPSNKLRYILATP